jgi:hypothetical protein
MVDAAVSAQVIASDGGRMARRRMLGAAGA